MLFLDDDDDDDDDDGDDDDDNGDGVAQHGGHSPANSNPGLQRTSLTFDIHLVLSTSLVPTPQLENAHAPHTHPRCFWKRVFLFSHCTVNGQCGNRNF